MASNLPELLDALKQYPRSPCTFYTESEPLPDFVVEAERLGLVTVRNRDDWIMGSITEVTLTSIRRPSPLNAFLGALWYAPIDLWHALFGHYRWHILTYSSPPTMRRMKQDRTWEYRPATDDEAQQNLDHQAW